MKNERGALLLETVVALAIFALAAVTALNLLLQVSDSDRRVQELERRIVDEERLLSAYTLLTRDDLDRRLGARRVGPYLVEVQRPQPTLYRVAVGDSARADLVTLVYRPENRRAP